MGEIIVALCTIPFLLVKAAFDAWELKERERAKKNIRLCLGIAYVLGLSLLFNSLIQKGIQF